MTITFKVDDVVPKEMHTIDPTSTHYLQNIRMVEKSGVDTKKTIAESSWDQTMTHSSDNGFVRGVMQAYNQHHNLVLRPDDIWSAITIQFGLHVSKNAETFRHMLVEHEGQKEVCVTADGTLHTVDMGHLLSIEMVKLLKENVKDPEICDWILPAFSTTTNDDIIVGSIVLMATMKEYFDYKMYLMCGIPEITLLGTPEDWDLIHSRVKKLRSFAECNKHFVEWADMLEKITENMAASSRGNIPDNFWQTMCHHHYGGSGPSVLSGWITAFCVFNDDGSWQGNKKEDAWREIKKQQFPVIDTDDIPCGVMTCPVLINDNGREINTILVSGHGAYVAADKYTVQPALGWALFPKSTDEFYCKTNHYISIDQSF